MEKADSIIVYVGFLVVATFFVFGFINDCNSSTKMELLSQKCDSVADRQEEVAKPINVYVRQEEVLAAIDDLKTEMQTQLYHLRLLFGSLQGSR